MSKQNTKFLRFAAQLFLGGTSLALATFVAFQLGFAVATTGFLYLIIIVLSATNGSGEISSLAAPSIDLVLTMVSKQ